jgi:hypothetical protein
VLDVVGSGGHGGRLSAGTDWQAFTMYSSMTSSQGKLAGFELNGYEPLFAKFVRLFRRPGVSS